MIITTGKVACAQKVVIYGPEGVGKSTFASHFPMPVFIDTEGSTKKLDVARYDPPTSWEMLLAQVKHLRDNNPGVFKTLVIDTADWAEMLCTTSVIASHSTDKASAKSIEDFGYGKGYVFVAEEFGRLLNLLEDIIAKGVNVCITAHAKMRKFEQPDEMGAYDRWEMKLSKQVAPMLKEWADMVLFANYRTMVVKESANKNAKSKGVGGTERVMYTTHHACWDAKNRDNLPDVLPFDFSAIEHCFPLLKQPQQPAPSVPSAPPEAPATQQIAEPALPAAEPVPQQPVAQMTLNIPPELPKPLRDLMAADSVDESEIRRLVGQKGYYPENTPIINYDPQFINGALIAGWSALMPLIIANRDLPF